MPLVSLIIPTRNEQETIKECIRRSREVFAGMRIDAEILVVDSSTDKTPDIARSMGALVVRPERLGYGNAYLYGFTWAHGRFLLLMDGDLTYDPAEFPRFIELLKEGSDLVIGSRLKGTIHPRSMPALHRYIGNPVLTRILNLLFKTGISDAHCGMRAITREALSRLSLHSAGMEFASEMLIQAALKNLVIREVPISYYPRKGESKLSSFSDGWRHLRFMMLFRPVPFLMIPGALALLLGLSLAFGVIAGERSDGLRMHSLILGSLLLIIGYQTFLTGLHFSAFGAIFGLPSKGRLTRWLMSYHSLEKELVIGLALLASGVAVGTRVLLSWKASGYGSLYEVQSAMMALILCILGLQTVFSGMFISLLLLKDGNER